MTALAERTAPSTSAGPTVRSVGRSARGPLVALLALVAVATLGAVLSQTGAGGRLDPDSPTPGGSRAVAQVLRDGGVPVRRVDTVEAVEQAVERSGGQALTLVVPVPSALVTAELERLGRLDTGLLVVGATDAQLSALGVPAQERGEAPVEPRAPACDLPVARTAGEVDLGGRSYRASSGRVTGCYAVGGEATLLALSDPGVVLLGDGAPLTNERLGQRGNAALSVGLLGERPAGVLWLVPRPGRPVAADRTLGDLVPDALVLAVAQVLVALGVVALWRARRLGRVVEEPLPVVVRAAEAVEGRSRLYRAAGARGAAADALRAASRERLARRVGASSATDRGLGALVVARTGDPPDVVEGLLYGGSPADDAALVRLADDLQALETAVSRTT